jgi:hypothetical protein
MSVSHQHSNQFSRSGETISGSVTVTGEGEPNLDVTVAANQTNKEVDYVLDVSTVTSLWLYSDKDLTIKTNSTSAPDDTIALKAGVPLPWESTTGYFDNPLTVDVTKFYLTNTLACRFQARILTDPTP